MKKYIIRWNAAYGDSYEVIEAKNLEEATDAAYEAWRDEAESNADYDAEEWTQELEDNYGI